MITKKLFNFISILIAFWAGVITLLFVWSKGTLANTGYSAPLVWFFLTAMFCVPFLVILLSDLARMKNNSIVSFLRIIFNVTWILIGLTFIFVDGNARLLNILVSVALLCVASLLASSFLKRTTPEEVDKNKIVVMGLSATAVTVLLSLNLSLIVLYSSAMFLANHYTFNNAVDDFIVVGLYGSGIMSPFSMVYVVGYLAKARSSLPLKLWMVFQGTLFGLNFIFVLLIAIIGQALRDVH